MMLRSISVGRPGRIIVVAVAGLWLVGCGRDAVREYGAPKETSPTSSPATASPHGAGPTVPTWTVPAGWTDRGASGMRVGSFGITNANGQSVDVSVIPLSSWEGRELENVNRWRAQVSLPAIQAEEVPQQMAAVEIGTDPGQLYEYAGQSAEDDKPRRILAAVLPLPGVAWFFKMTGDDALVAEHKPAFVAFLKSVKRDGGGATVDPHAGLVTPATADPHAGPAMPLMSIQPAPSKPESSKPAWTVPTGWQEVAPGNMQFARFSTPNPDGTKAEVTVSVLGGTGGGALANVNRWRGQIGLAPIDEAGLAKLTTSIETGAGTATAVDLVADSKEKRTVAVWLARGGQTWFYRLTGSDAAVTPQKDVFVSFVQSVR
jgi:hypothetical protein